MLFFTCAYAQKSGFYPVLDSLQAKKVTDTITSIVKDGVMRISHLRIISADCDDRHKLLTLNFNAALAEYPARPASVQAVYSAVRSILKGKYNNYKLRIISDNKELSELIPAYFNPEFKGLTKHQKERNRREYVKHVTPKSPGKIKKETGRKTPEQKAADARLQKRLEGINATKAERLEQIKKDNRITARHDWPDLGPTPLVRREDMPYEISNGLQNKHIALWQSHGLYYEQRLARWEWQRARIFQTVEDLYTMSYVLPYLTPMLENAGAVVMLPRERDTQPNEVIVDNDNPESGYSEMNGYYSWTKDKIDAQGFAHTKEIYTGYDNPFKMGTFRSTGTLNVTGSGRNEKPSVVEWTPDIPETGEYAVYVSYKSLPLSARDARYTVHHKGGETRFRVNQQMGGGTWIYLGTFMFEAGRQLSGRVTLTNQSEEKDAVITADAVKFGGGTGNIGRYAEDSVQKALYGDAAFPPLVSHYPRFTEGARYWLQWAGFADSVYTFYEGRNDYTDDYSSRGRWVNALAGGSEKHPLNPGLKIPIDLSFAFHTDAGTTLNDSIIGTLAIYTRTCEGTELLPTGDERLTSRDYTDLVQTQIVNDLRATWNPDWTRRGIWNRSYAESRLPQVPAMLLELLSHQNFADMRYGLDPNFRFTVSRAIYKGMLRYLSSTEGYEYVVQPLPVNSFGIAFTEDGKAHLSWLPTADNLEPTASSDGYVVYTRIGGNDQAFDKGHFVTGHSLTLPIEYGKHYSFKITAVNRGGESFPSEILSICKVPDEKGKILIVNGFTRVSAPDSYASSDSLFGGFTDQLDHGVPYKKDISYIGSQYEFRRIIPWMDDDSPGFGASHSTCETTVLPGNTFDYPLVHGEAFVRAGYSYTSSSLRAFTAEERTVRPDGYFAVDLILGKQKQIKRGGTGPFGIHYQAFSPDLQHVLAMYAQQGGNMIISGAYVATDIWDGVERDSLCIHFAEDVLKFKWRSDHASESGEIIAAPSPFKAFYNGELSNRPLFRFNTRLNSTVYAVESPDALEPSCPEAFTIFRYRDNRFSAGVAYRGPYSTVVLGFPIETLSTPDERAELISQCLYFFNTDK